MRKQTPSRDFGRVRAATLWVASLALALPVGATGNHTPPDPRPSEPRCEVIDFNDFSHGESFESISLFNDEVALHFSVLRNNPAGIVAATAYDTERWNLTDFLAPNDTHNDSQRAILCNDAANGGNGTCDGRILVVPDARFENFGDDTQGGFITITGFDGMFEIPAYDAVDSDNTDRDIILRVGEGLVQVGTSTGLGDGTVETVVTDSHVFSDLAEFEYEGSGGVDNIEICQIPDAFCGDGFVDSNEQCDDGNNVDGDGCSAICEIERHAGQGCTPGYWKQSHHFGSWDGFAPGDDFASIFGLDDAAVESLHDALTQGGGGESALGRHAVAALLNASNDEVDYFDSVDGVIERVREAYSTGDFEGAKNVLAHQNEMMCPLGRDEGPTCEGKACKSAKSGKSDKSAKSDKSGKSGKSHKDHSDCRH